MRLRRSDPNKPGLTRRRHGRGWRYLDADGAAVGDEDADRARALVIPPAWRDVWISPHPNGHIQAVGVDDAGRRQYLYHEQWRRERDEEKHERVADLVGLLPRFRAAVARDLATSGLGRDRVLAGALRMLDHGVFRTGGEEYAEENGSRGVVTLLCEDVAVDRGQLVFCFPAKSGIRRDLRLDDPELVPLVRALRRGRDGGEQLFVHRVDGELRPVRSSEVNPRFRELTGSEHTVKDLRTWHATVVAATAFADLAGPTTARARRAIEIQVLDRVAEELGNTRAVARRSYVDPRVVAAFHDGRTIRPVGKSTTRRTMERRALRLLLES